MFNPRSQRLITILCATALISLVAISGQIARCSDEVSASFVTVTAKTSLNEPIFVDFSVHNGLQSAIRLDLGYARKGRFEFSVREPDGSIVRLPKISGGGFVPSGNVVVASGRTYTQRLLLSEWHQFNHPGVYVVEARLAISIVAELTSKALSLAHSQELQLIVEPRNRKRLQEVCGKLAETAIESPDAETAMNAARALSYVRDPEALPYLRRMLNGGAFTQGAAIQGLVRYGGPQATKLLESNLDAKDPELKLAIRQALQEIKTGVHPNVAD